MVRECFTGGKGFFAADAAGTAVIVHCLCTAGSGRFEVDFVGILAVKAVGMPGCGHDFIMADRTELRGGFGGSVTGGVPLRPPSHRNRRMRASVPWHP